MTSCFHIYVLTTGETATIFEASRSWTPAHRKAYRELLRLIIQQLWDDLVSGAIPRDHYVVNSRSSPARMAGSLYRYDNNILLVVTSISFDGNGFDPNGGGGQDALAFEAVQYRSVFLIMALGNTWNFEQIAGDPIFSRDQLCDNRENISNRWQISIGFGPPIVGGASFDWASWRPDYSRCYLLCLRSSIILSAGADVTDAGTDGVSFNLPQNMTASEQEICDGTILSSWDNQSLI